MDLWWASGVPVGASVRRVCPSVVGVGSALSPLPGSSTSGRGDGVDRDGPIGTDHPSADAAGTGHVSAVPAGTLHGGVRCVVPIPGHGRDWSGQDLHPHHTGGRV